MVDGIRNCLWGAFKSAIKNWFNQKLEEVLGLGLAIWKMIKSGCLSLAKVGKMAWEGLKAAIPVVLITLLIEKLVSMIVPAAGAIMTIIEGLKAAWGTVSRILQAFALFMVFLKAVKTGNAAGPFARTVAAAAIIVIDFVANWLLQRLRKPAGAISGRIKAMAQNMFKRGAAVAKGHGCGQEGHGCGQEGHGCGQEGHGCGQEGHGCGQEGAGCCWKWIKENRKSYHTQQDLACPQKKQDRSFD